MQNWECWSCTTTFFTKFCDVNNFEELEMDTDSLYLVFAYKELEDCTTRNEGRMAATLVKSLYQLFHCWCSRKFFSPECAVTGTKYLTSESLVFSKRNSGVRKCGVFVVKITAATTKLLINWNSAAKASIREYWSKLVLVFKKSIAKFLIKMLTLHLQTEVSEQRIT